MDHPLIGYLSEFRTVSAEEQDCLISAFDTRELKEGDYLFKGGGICHDLFFIAEGVLRIVVINDKGTPVTHYFLSENQFCTILHSFNNEVAAEESIEAACSATVLSIRKSKFLQLCQSLPWLKDLIDQLTRERLLEKIRIRNAYLGEDAAARYRLFIDRQPDIARRVSQQDIASYLGITPQSLSRIRKEISR